MYRHWQNKREYSLYEARELMRQALEGAAELRRDFDTLPETQPDGSTPCPVAEDAFYRKEKSAQFVRDDLSDLRRFLQAATETIAQLESKTDEIAHERESLHGAPAQDKFAEAEQGLQSQIQAHQQVRRDLLETISEVEATLREADSRRFPGGDPRGPFGQSVHSEPQTPRPLDEITATNAKDEIDRLMRITEDQ